MVLFKKKKIEKITSKVSYPVFNFRLIPTVLWWSTCSKICTAFSKKTDLY